MHQWNTQEQETFQFMAAAFDVRAAKQILADRAEAGKPHEVGEIQVTDVSSWVGEPGKLVMGIGVDWDRVQHDPTIDLTVPVVLAYTKGGSFLPIDGWHRIAKAKLAGIEKLPAVALTKAESKRCRIR